MNLNIKRIKVAGIYEIMEIPCVILLCEVSSNKRDKYILFKMYLSDYIEIESLIKHPLSNSLYPTDLVSLFNLETRHYKKAAELLGIEYIDMNTFKDKFLYEGIHFKEEHLMDAIIKVERESSAISDAIPMINSLFKESFIDEKEINKYRTIDDNIYFRSTILA